MGDVGRCWESDLCAFLFVHQESVEPKLQNKLCDNLGSRCFCDALLGYDSASCRVGSFMICRSTTMFFSVVTSAALPWRDSAPGASDELQICRPPFLDKPNLSLHPEPQPVKPRGASIQVGPISNSSNRISISYAYPILYWIQGQFHIVHIYS